MCSKVDYLHISSTQRSFHATLSDQKLEQMSHKNFSEDTMKKVKWVVKMNHDWSVHRNSSDDLDGIYFDFHKKETIMQDTLLFALTRFTMEVKKMDGNDFPAKTLYKILICVQFHLETMGFGWKLLSAEAFKELKFTLDNIMKLHTSRGFGKKVKLVDILTSTHA